ncbi:MAG: TRAP-type C4-dicarboxylate transport system, small permease component [candidate division NC10 bacterium]|jgi:TRAP-type C4-dicarboxylate transport system permease small subunit|nr:TRAP-type C4-dicarboxylate transport system, small permease component [candidate division NC10 bacterium]
MLLEKVAKAADRLLTVWIVGALVVMVLTIISDVFLRETVSYPLTWNLEVAQYCLINLTYVGAALAFRHRAHISINTVTALLPAAAQKWVDVVARILVLPFLLILAYSGLQILQKAKGVTPTLRLPIWVYYFPIFVGAVLLCFYGVVQVIEAISAARSGRETEAGAGTPRGAI